MAKIIHLDTHAVIWLYSGQRDLFPKNAIDLIEVNNIEISPIVKLELEYLYEIKRISVKPNEILYDLENELDLRIFNADFNEIINESLKQNWTRDPFDRIIVSSAAVNNYKLITKDEIIRKHYKNAKWE